MSIDIDWDNDDRQIIKAVFQGRWTWQEYLDGKEKAETMLASVEHRVDFISDMTEGSFVPQSALSNLSRAFAGAPRNLGLNVIVGGNTFVRILLQSLGKIVPHSPASNIRFAETLDEAYDVVAQDREATG